LTRCRRRSATFGRPCKYASSIGLGVFGCFKLEGQSVYISAFLFGEHFDYFCCCPGFTGAAVHASMVKRGSQATALLLISECSRKVIPIRSVNVVSKGNFQRRHSRQPIIIVLYTIFRRILAKLRDCKAVPLLPMCATREVWVFESSAQFRRIFGERLDVGPSSSTPYYFPRLIGSILRALGLHTRMYRIGPGGNVTCGLSWREVCAKTRRTCPLFSARP
jgi:hypothetical protein